MRYKLPVYGLRLVRESAVEYADMEAVNNSRAVAELANRLLKDSPIEEFLVFFLDNQNRLIGMTRQKGTVNQTPVFPAEIFKVALTLGVTVSLIFLHNHPSGVLKPSPEDIRLHQKLVEAARLFQMSVLDNLIVDGMGGHYSFHEAGIL